MKSRGSPFNHRIKSISTSSFTPEEVAKIVNEGGNAVKFYIFIFSTSFK